MQKKFNDSTNAAPLPGKSDNALGSPPNNGTQKGETHNNSNQNLRENPQSEASRKAGEDALTHEDDTSSLSSDQIISEAKNADQPWNGNNDGTANKLRKNTGGGEERV